MTGFPSLRGKTPFEAARLLRAAVAASSAVLGGPAQSASVTATTTAAWRYGHEVPDFDPLIWEAIEPSGDLLITQSGFVDGRVTSTLTLDTADPDVKLYDPRHPGIAFSNKSKYHIAIRQFQVVVGSSVVIRFDSATDRVSFPFGEAGVETSLYDAYSLGMVAPGTEEDAPHDELVLQAVTRQVYSGHISPGSGQFETIALRAITTVGQEPVPAEPIPIPGAGLLLVRGLAALPTGSRA